MAHSNINTSYVTDSGIILAIGASDATKSSLRQGEFYRFTATTATAVRFGGAASVADGGFDFMVQPGDSVIVQAPGANVHGIQVSAAGTLFIQRLNQAA